jgi:hypothetical protein
MFFLRWDCKISQTAFLESLRDDPLSDTPFLRQIREWKIARDGNIDLVWNCFSENRWPAFYDEVEQYIVSRFRIAHDSAARAVFRVQRHVMASSGRRIPDTITLDHDFVSYFWDIMDGTYQRPLRDYKSASLTVWDPAGICIKEKSPLRYDAHCGVLELQSDLRSSRDGPFTSNTRFQR